MKKYLSIIVLSLLLLPLFTKAQVAKSTFKVMAWNILHGGNDIENGVDEVIGIIKTLDPDVILMVETYGSGPTIADSLGYNFHLVASSNTKLNDPSVNLSIYSKYPFGERIDTEFPFYLGGREVIIEGQKVNFFANWFHYLPWSDEPHKLGMNTAQLLEWEKSESRYNMIQKVLPTFQKYSQLTETTPMIVGGDFNSYSYLDWTEATADIHNGLVVPWYALKCLAGLGLKDSYRELNPNPQSHPGITWDNKERVDEHRIDYIFYKSPVLKAVSSDTYMGYFNETFRIGEQKFTYPSDHGIVVTAFELLK